MQPPAAPPLPAPSAPPALFRKTSNTHLELFPKFEPQNKFFDNHEYRSLKLLLFLDSEHGQIYEVRAFFQSADSDEA